MGFLSWMFKQDNRSGWEDIAKELGANLLWSQSPGSSAISLIDDGWEIVLDTYRIEGEYIDDIYTRIRTPFTHIGGLEFSIFPEHIFYSIGKLGGLTDIKVGDLDFDNRFVVRGNNEEKIKELLEPYEIRALIDSFYDPKFEIRDTVRDWPYPKFPGQLRVLYYECKGLIEDRNVIINLFLLYGLLIRRLVKIGCAKPEPPNLRLVKNMYE